MTTKKILVTGLGAGVTEVDIRSWLGRFGRVVQVDIIREGSTADSSAVVEMVIGDAVAAYLVMRLSSFWAEGSLVRSRLLNH